MAPGIQSGSREPRSRRICTHWVAGTLGPREYLHRDHRAGTAGAGQGKAWRIMDAPLQEYERSTTTLIITVMFSVAGLVVWVLQLYVLLIFAWTFGSFFPQWRYQRWYQVVGEIVQPYLNLFRWLPLRIQTGGATMDLTPTVAMFVLLSFIYMINMSATGGH